jgi:hypothetical protein
VSWFRRAGAVLAAAILLASLAAGCGDALGRARTGDGAAGGLAASVPGAASGAAGSARAGLPGFPAETCAWPLPARATSETTSQTGGGFIEQSSGSASYTVSAPAGAYVLVPPDGESFAWTHYRFPGVIGDRPVSLTVSTDYAAAAPGSNLVAPAYWVGVADYTTYTWEWHGPENGSTMLQLNAAANGDNPALLDRYVSAAGSVHVVIVADATRVAPSPTNPAGLTAVRVNTLAVDTSPDYLQNKPHWAGFTYAGIGAGSAGKRGAGKLAATLRPEQFAYLEWTHVPAFDEADELNAADDYVITRQGPADAQPVTVLSSIASQFVDPLDVLDGVAPARGGTLYLYTLYAENEAGHSRPSQARLMVPITAPLNLHATVNSTAADGVELDWQPVDGAAEYRIYRGESALAAEAELLATVPGAQAAYTDATAAPGWEWWYFVCAAGLGDGNAANGLEQGQESAPSLGAKGVRAVLLELSCATPGVSGAGSAESPFVLVAGGTYQFRALGQASVEYTGMVQWSVAPDSAAEFAASPQGQLVNIAPGASSFTITATYNYLAYSWQASAHCAVQ